MERIAKSLVAAFAFAMIGLATAAFAPTASAQTCDAGSILPADNSYAFSTLPFCDGQAVLVPSSPGVPYGYTSVGNTAFVNGQPVGTPWSNVSVYTPRQAAAQRAAGNLSATANAYSQYGGFTPPATVHVEQSPSRSMNGY